jgi:hypothetical protein
MGRRINYRVARAALDEMFNVAQQDFQTRSPVPVQQAITDATSVLFASHTQAFREALVGCALARIIDPGINIRFPYFKQSADAFTGRQLDQKVVNPFFRVNTIPASTGPYLSTIRRNFRFIPEAADRGIRDAAAFKSFLVFISVLERANPDEARHYLRYILYQFLDLRDRADVRLTQVGRLSLHQLDTLVGNLLGQPSGGLLPVVLAVATLQTVRQRFNLTWEINWQGINVADRATGAGGDITVSDQSQVVMAIEVSEREIDEHRVMATFTAKIAPSAIRDYLFLFSEARPTDEAERTAGLFFPQGFDLNFLPVKDWMHFVLGTLGPTGREMFGANLLQVLADNRVPAAIRLTWNEQASRSIRAT